MYVKEFYGYLINKADEQMNHICVCDRENAYQR